MKTICSNYRVTRLRRIIQVQLLSCYYAVVVLRPEAGRNEENATETLFELLPQPEVGNNTTSTIRDQGLGVLEAEKILNEVLEEVVAFKELMDMAEGDNTEKVLFGGTVPTDTTESLHS